MDGVVTLTGEQDVPDGARNYYPVLSRIEETRKRPAAYSRPEEGNLIPYRGSRSGTGQGPSTITTTAEVIWGRVKDLGQGYTSAPALNHSGGDHS